MITLGDKDQFHALHVWGGIQGAYAPAQDVRDWTFQQDGATFDTEGNLKALEKLKEWADKGYFGKADTYNARGESDAGVVFGKGQGALLIAGNWQAATARDGLGDDAEFFNMPPGDSGKRVNIGSTSFPMHISAKTKQPDLAAAYLDWITGPSRRRRRWSTPQQVPAATDATAEPGDPLGREVKAGWDELVQDGGLTLYPDWSSPTMLHDDGPDLPGAAGRADLAAGRDLADPEGLGAVPPGADGELRLPNWWRP